MCHSSPRIVYSQFTWKRFEFHFFFSGLMHVVHGTISGWRAMISCLNTPSNFTELQNGYIITRQVMFSKLSSHTLWKNNIFPSKWDILLVGGLCGAIIKQYHRKAISLPHSHVPRPVRLFVGKTWRVQMQRLLYRGSDLTLIWTPISVHSRILSIQVFLCLLLRLSPTRVPYTIVFA